MPILSWGMAPALAAGCTVVAKPAEMTPLTAMRIGVARVGGGPARGGVPRTARQGQRGRAAAGRPPGGAEDRLHRVDRGGPVDHGGVRAPDQAADARTRRQEREHHLRRRRLGAGGGDRAVRGVRQRRPGLLRAVPDPGRRLACWTSSWRLFETAVQGVAVGRPRLGGHRDGAADLGGAPGARGLLRARRTRRWRSAGSAPAGPGFWYPPTVLAPVGPDDPAYTEEVFGPVVTVTPFADEAEAIAHRERHAVRAVRVDLDSRRGPGDPGGPRAWRPATCR